MSEKKDNVTWTPEEASSVSMLMLGRVESLLLTVLQMQELILEKQGVPKEEVQGISDQLLAANSGEAGLERLKQVLNQVQSTSTSVVKRATVRRF